MWTILPKNNLDDFLQNHPEFNNYENEFLLQENDDYYILPRFFHKAYNDNFLHPHEDKTFNSEPIDIEFTAELRPYQQEGADQLKLLWNYNGEIKGLFKAHPGYGKTVLGAWATCLTKQKTLIILDNSILVQQWKDAYLNFTDLTEDDIGIFQGTTVEIDKPVVITMVQTLIAKQKSNMKEWYSKIKEAGFGLVFYDEVHATASGPKYALASLFINTRNVVGWSATPYAHGINKILLSNCIGELIYSAKEYETQPEINFIKYDSGLGKKHGYRISRSKDYVKMIAFYNSIISDSQPYLDKILELAFNLEKQGHATLIIASTIKQVEAIVEHLRSNGLNAIPFHANERELNRDVDRLLVGTQKFISKGFDFNILSALIYAIPLKGKISLIQTIGRILRRKEGKLDPVVYDLIDTGFGQQFTGTIMTKKSILKKEFGDDIQINES
jgi:superfamily II DNA or RNA helicase